MKPTTQIPIQAQKLSNLINDIQDKIETALVHASSILEYQVIFNDGMLGAMPNSETDSGHPPPEGRLHQIVETLGVLNKRLSNMREEQGRMQQIIDI